MIKSFQLATVRNTLTRNIIGMQNNRLMLRFSLRFAINASALHTRKSRLIRVELIAFDMSSTQSYLLLVSCTPAVNNFEIFGHKFASFEAKGIS